MFRVRDIKNEKWIDNVVLSSNNELYKVKKFLFINKLIPLSHNEYVYHNDIQLYDKNSILIYEGDYLEAEVSEDKIVTGIVCFSNKLSSYIIVPFDDKEYLLISESVCDRIRVIGNVFEKPKED